jgi:hypothetical protein
MRKFTKIVAPALFATLALGAVVPAQAQSYNNHSNHNAGRPTPGRDNQIRTDINNLSRSIDRAIARRTISNREATGLRRDAAEIQRLYGQYARNGLTQTEQRTLRNRVDRIENALRNERRDNDGRRR